MSGIERILRRAQGKQLHKKKTIEKPEVGSALSLLQALDNYLEGQNSTGFKRVSGFHPSSTSLCARYYFLAFEGAPTASKISARTQRIFDNGHEVHDRWYRYFKDMGILVDSEIPILIKDPVPITGTADGIINWGGNKLIEMKSIGMEGFLYRKYYGKPKDDHYNQSQIYLLALKLEKGFVIYEDKGTQNALAFEIERNEEHIEKLMKRYKKWYKYIEKGTMPDRPYKRDSKQCTECPFEQHCWDGLPD